MPALSRLFRTVLPSSVVLGLVLSVALGIALETTPARADELISPFAGSELAAEYRAEFERLVLAVEGPEGSRAPDTIEAEGKLHSRFFTKPEGRSSREIFLSYQRELKGAGFDILLALDTIKGPVLNVIQGVSRDGGNAVLSRPYQGAVRGGASNDKARTTTFVDYYLSARKTTADATYHVAIIIGREDYMYLVDVMTSAAMETGTVALNPALLKEKLESEGRVAIYDILFDTNSAEIRPESRDALGTIAKLMKDNASYSFYVVGHTDDTGGLDHNLDLSSRRAHSVATALTSDFGIAASRLEARGVGPLAPVGSNNAPAGRDRNRRVELVLRLQS